MVRAARVQLLTDVVVVEDSLALLERERLGAGHGAAAEVGLTLLGGADALVRAGDGGEACVVVQRSVPLDGVVLDRQCGELLGGSSGRLDVVAVPRKRVVLVKGVDEDVEELWCVLVWKVEGAGTTS